MNEKTTTSAKKAATKQSADKAKKPSRADVARIWTEGLASPDPAHASAVAGVLAKQVERVDARGTETDRAKVIAEFGQSPLAAHFATGTWSQPTVTGNVVTSTCTFKPGAPWSGATVMITVTAAGNISRVETVSTDEPQSGGSAGMSPDLAHVIHEVLRVTPSRIEPVRTMSGLRVHRVVVDDRVIYIKHGHATDTGGRFTLEAWAQQLCRAKGVLVPEVLAASEPGDEIDYMVTLPLAGRALEQLATGGRPTVTGDALTPILREAGRQLRAMHEIEVAGFGPIVGAPPHGAYERWSRFLELAREALPNLADHGVLSRNDAASIDVQLAEAHSTLDPDITGRLLHGDLEGDHLFSHRGRFTGFLDFEKMQAGDPVHDLARLAWWDPHMLPDVLDGYGRDALTGDDINIRMPAYLVAHAVAGWAWLAVEDVGARPIRTGEASMFVRAARQRDLAAIVAGRGSAALRASDQQPSQLQILIDAVKGRTDDEITRFAAGLGGFPRLCALVFQGMRSTRKPEDCTVGFVLGDDMAWVFRASRGKNTVTKRVPKRAPAIVHASPADFLRMVIADLDWDAAVASGRIKVEGDEEEVRTLLAGGSQR